MEEHQTATASSYDDAPTHRRGSRRPSGTCRASASVLGTVPVPSRVWRLLPLPYRRLLERPFLPACVAANVDGVDGYLSSTGRGLGRFDVGSGRNLPLRATPWATDDGLKCVQAHETSSWNLGRRV